jgi:pectate lyase
VIDARIVDEVRSGSVHYQGTKASSWGPGDKNAPNYPGIIDTQTDVHDADDSPNKPWPDYRTYNVPADTDHDGMPDDWERQHNLNPTDPADGNVDPIGDGYTNLERYLHELAAPAFIAQ